MATNELNENIILANSPVEFAIIGPQKGSRSVIARSSNAGLDLIGSHSINSKEAARLLDKRVSQGGLSSILEYHKVKGVNTLAISNNDSRSTDYWFIWKGIAAPEEKEVIEEEFSRRLTDILEAKEKSTGLLEWSVAPIITLCESLTKYHIERKNKKKFMIGVILGAYILTVILAWFIKDLVL